MRRFVLGRILAAVALVLLAVSCGSEESTPPPNAAATAPVAAPVAAPEKLADSLKVVCWDDYITPAVAQDFQKEFGVRLDIQFVNNNEEVLDRLGKGEVWDVWTPSDYAVQAAAERNLLAPLDKAAIPNLANVGRRFQNAIYDREFRFSVPFYWGTTGLGYDKKVFATPPESWGYVFDPKRRGRAAGRISLLDDMREAFSIALIYLGYDPNTTDPAALLKARNLLVATKPALSGFDSETFEDNLASGKVALTHGWSGDLSQIVAEDPTKGFALPKEGFMLWVDNLAIPAASTKKKTAEVLIDYLLRPEVSAKLTNANRNPTTVPSARPMIDPKVLASPSYQLPDDRPFHVIKYLGADTAKLEKYWQEIVGGKK
ncbi:MAG TPA: spermidine/putrescine ABC transporter substrate-binding protein [Thermoanaerobaculia bacterium]|nr:spermidine/putrescine ABC transporter substrate-binding protein [Thermoanaerobaculia bacterium]